MKTEQIVEIFLGTCPTVHGTSPEAEDDLTTATAKVSRGLAVSLWQWSISPVAAAHIVLYWWYPLTMACTANVLLVEDIVQVPQRFFFLTGTRLTGLDSRLTLWRGCMLMCACAKRLISDHENKIREILCRGPSAKIYTLEIYPLYGIRLSCLEIGAVNERSYS